MTSQQDFHSGLKAHLFARLKGLDSADDEVSITDADRNDVVIRNNRMHSHPRVTINYTSYDMEIEKDSIGSAAMKKDIMILARDREASDNEESPFWYARVLGVYHVEAHLLSDRVREPSRVDFLWVRWFGRAVEDRYGDDVCRLERIRFVSMDDGTSPFGFVDPSIVVRAVHLIPAFRYGRTKQLLGPTSLARGSGTDLSTDDWESYYVNK